jgi:hypothetical protein
MFTKQQKSMAISWLLWFVGILTTTLLATVQQNIASHTVPLITTADLINALWAALGAVVAVVIQSLDSKYTRYGVGAAAATPAVDVAPATPAVDVAPAVDAAPKA